MTLFKCNDRTATASPHVLVHLPTPLAFTLVANHSVPGFAMSWLTIVSPKERRDQGIKPCQGRGEGSCTEGLFELIPWFDVPPESSK